MEEIEALGDRVRRDHGPKPSEGDFFAASAVSVRRLLQLDREMAGGGKARARRNKEEEASGVPRRNKWQRVAASSPPQLSKPLLGRMIRQP